MQKTLAKRECGEEAEHSAGLGDNAAIRRCYLPVNCRRDTYICVYMDVYST